MAASWRSRQPRRRHGGLALADLTPCPATEAVVAVANSLRCPASVVGVPPMATKTITHWIDGKLYERAPERTRRRVQPRDRRGPGQGRVRDRPRSSTRRSSRAARAPQTLAHRVDREAHEDPVRVPRARRQAPARDRAAAHARARQGHRATRSARSTAASRSSSSRAASPTSRRASTPRTSRPRSTPTRSASRSASSPASRRSTSRRWCRCGCIRSRSRAGTRSCSSRASAIRRRRCFCAQLLADAGPAARRVQRRPRRQGRGRPPARAPEGRRDLVRRLDADRAVHLRDRHASTASACRRSAARRTT